jgi:hypothetical protein
VGVRCVPAEDVLPGRWAQGGAAGLGMTELFSRKDVAGGEHKA